MKKFFRFLLILILIVGGCAAYFFFANGKMMVGVLKSDKEALSTTLNNSIKKVHDYGNFNFSYSKENKKTGVTTNSQLLIKFDGENRYFSAEVTTIKGDKTTNTSYYCEAKGDVATLYMTTGEQKRYSLTSWDKALAEVLTIDYSALVEGDILPNYIRDILENDRIVAKEKFVEEFQSSKVIFSLKPFYYGAKLSLKNSSSSISYDISNRGILRKIEKTTNTLLLDQSETLTINKPGKAVSINSLSDEQKKEFTILG